MENQSHLFSLPANVHYLNCATMSPLLKSVEDAGMVGLRRKSQPYNIVQENFFDTFELIQQEFSSLIHCPDKDRIAIMGSVSYAMATVSKNIIHKGLAKPGKKVLLLAEEFPSDVYAWDELKTYGVSIEFIQAPTNTPKRGLSWNEAFINAIDDQTILVCLSPAHWADGTLFDLQKINEKCKASNCLLVVDGTQYIGAYPFDVTSIDAVLVVAASYKWLLGPYGNALCYLSEWFDDGLPLEQNWAMRLQSNDFKNLINYQYEYRPKAYRYNMGEFSNFINLPMILTALKQINVWKPEEIQAYCRTLAGPHIHRLTEGGFWIEKETHRADHLFGIRIPESKHLSIIQQNLLRENVFVSFRGSAIRVSVHVWNNTQDLEVFTSILMSS